MNSDIRQLLAEADSATALSDFGDVERPYMEGEAAMVWSRARGLFAAARCLMNEGHVHEAAILTRPLFEDSLVLTEMASVSQEGRVAIAVSRKLDALSRLEGIFRRTEKRGEGVEGNMAYIAQRSSALRTYASRNGVSTGWTQKLDKLAKRHHRYGKEYDGYLLSHQFVHGSAAITEMQAADEGGAVVVGGEAVDTERWALPTAVSLAYSIALTQRATCRILALEEPDGLSALIDKLEDMAGYGADGGTVDNPEDP